jgi:rfaE bifunctional protein nucleotidyltransferase chain/domain
MHGKIKSLKEIEEILKEHRKQGLRVVQCHGVFDLLHPGHIRHLKSAKNQGDRLVVTVTPDRYVNKGPGRPAFDENLRLESLAALDCIDYVVLNDAPDAAGVIRRMQPHLYVKGSEYSNPEEDVTGKITEEVQAVESGGGSVYFTDDMVFSSSALINRHFESEPSQVSEFISKLKTAYSSNDLLRMIEDLSRLKVLVVGDAIIDEYQYVEPLGQSAKGLHMAARCLEKEVFLGGSLIIANHLAQFAGHVSLLTAVGKDCPYLEMLDPRVDQRCVRLDNPKTLTKKRYVLQDGKTLSKLFETYAHGDASLNQAQTDRIVDIIRSEARHYDLVLACDFGNGFTNPALIDALSNIPTFLAVNTQTNSGNRGYNVITHYQRADFICLNEPELRLAAHDRHSPIEELAHHIGKKMQCPDLSVTQGIQGVFCYSAHAPSLQIPALTSHIVDRVGAGDSYLALSSLCMAKGYPLLLAGFFGSLAAALDVQIVGNREPVKKAYLSKFLTRLMK